MGDCCCGLLLGELEQVLILISNDFDFTRIKMKLELATLTKKSVKNTTTEIIFLIEEDPEGGYTARALGESIFTQANDLATLKEMVRDAVHCHFPEEATCPKVIRLHIVRDEVIAS